MILKRPGSLLLLAAGLLFARGALAQQYVCMETNLGEFCMELYADSAPNTVDNFLNYVERGDFDNTMIHRSVPDVIIQGGGYYLDPLALPVEEETTVDNEYSLPNVRGSVAMAKLPGQPDSATNQWFINLGNNAGLDFTDGGYTVFASVVSGMNVVDIIGNLQRVTLAQYFGAPFQEVPVLRKPAAGLGLEDFVEIRRAWATDTLPTPALADFEDGSLVFPVRVGGYLYVATLRLTGTAAEPTFKAERSDLVAIVDADIEAAEYKAGEKLLVIPSVRVGDRLLNNVTLKLIDLPELVFELQSYE